MKTKTLDDLVTYIYKKYTYPKSWWSKVHFEKRCCEIYASEQAILKCIEQPLKDPKEIIFDYIVSMEASLKDSSDESKKVINIIIRTLNDLYEYF